MKAVDRYGVAIDEGVWRLEEGAPRAETLLPTTFALNAPKGRMTALGVRRRLESGPASTLGHRVERFFSAVDSGPPLLVGALPFEREAGDCLFQPERLTDDERLFDPRSYPAQPRRWAVRPEPSASAYQDAVAQALRLMEEAHADPLVKVVLSRSLVLTADRPVDPQWLAARLSSDPAAACFIARLGLDAAGRQRSLVGATPELLVSKAGRNIASHPLAGSSARHADPEQDRLSAAALEQSDKDRREHAMVVEAILDTLTPYCTQLRAAGSAAAQPTATMWHLGTPIEGQLKDADISSAALAALLHPTPAVGGCPTRGAREVIRELESYDRGFYSGAVGWTDAAGDGAWYVSLRCAEVAGSEVRLYAGAGIVRGSIPEGEVRETSAKFQTMLRALGVDEEGRSLEAGER